MMPLVAPWSLSADFGRPTETVLAADAAGLDWIHVDVMDYRLVHSSQLRAGGDRGRTGDREPSNVLPETVEPERYLEDKARAGTAHILIRYEPWSTPLLLTNSWCTVATST